MARSSAEIEREIDAERDELAGTLHEVRERMSLEAGLQRVAETLRDNGQEIAAGIGRQMRDNPFGIALTGAGVLWLIVGSRSGNTAGTSHGSHRNRQSGRFGYGQEYGGDTGAMEDWTSGSGAFPPREDVGAPRYGEARRRLGGQDAGEAGVMGAASDGMHRAAEGARGAASQARSRAKDLRDRIGEGLEEFSEEARRRVLDARHAAADALEWSERRAARLGSRAGDFFADNPLVTGAVFIAAGAAMAAMLPKTETEDRLMGDEAERLMAWARRIYEEEKQLVKDTAGAMAQTAREAGREMSEVAAEALDREGEHLSDAIRTGTETAEEGAGAAEEPGPGTGPQGGPATGPEPDSLPRRGPGSKGPAGLP